MGRPLGVWLPEKGETTVQLVPPQQPELNDMVGG